MTSAAPIPPVIDEKKGPQPGNFDWYPDLTGKTCVIVASGPSARENEYDILRGREDVYIIGINDSWKLAPWCEMLYACDHQWVIKRKGHWAGHAGLKVTQDRQVADILAQNNVWHRVFAVRGVEHIHTDQKGYIGWFGNSGTQALNLAVHFGPSKIILCGFDMTLQNGDHWHGRHYGGLHNPKPQYVRRWRRVTDRAFHTLQRLGIKAFSTSMEGALQDWPKLSLERALNE